MTEPTIARDDSPTTDRPTSLAEAHDDVVAAFYACISTATRHGVSDQVASLVDRYGPAVFENAVWPALGEIVQAIGQLSVADRLRVAAVLEAWMAAESSVEWGSHGDATDAVAALRRQISWARRQRREAAATPSVA